VLQIRKRGADLSCAVVCFVAFGLQIRKGTTLLTETLGSAPTNQELASHLGISTRRVEEVQQWQMQTVSLDKVELTLDQVGFTQKTNKQNSAYFWAQGGLAF
jgi:DNA-directed RNA polymerase sigma subunit (sigma70/sigma32)